MRIPSWIAGAAMWATLVECSLAAPPPSPASPSPPAPSRAVAIQADSESAVDPDIVLTNGADSVLVSPDVEMVGVAFFSQVNGPGGFELELLDGRKLWVSDTTSVGRYALANGDSLLLGSEKKFPRGYTLRPRGQRACRFRVRSSRGIAVLVQRGADAKADSARVAAMISRPGSLPRTDDGLHLQADAEAQLVLVPGSWYWSGAIGLPKGWDGMKLSFFVYGPESPKRPRHASKRVRRVGSIPARQVEGEHGPEEKLLRYPPDELLASSTLIRGNISLSASPD